MKWLRIDEHVPAVDQKVFYYFGYFDRVYAGEYKGSGYYKGELIIKNMFVDDRGVLGDDVTYWMPRYDGSSIPRGPSPKQKMNDLYHPRDKKNRRCMREWKNCEDKSPECPVCRGWGWYQTRVILHEAGYRWENSRRPKPISGGKRTQWVR